MELSGYEFLTCSCDMRRDCLPTRQKLQQRGIVTPLSCVMYGTDVENPWHAFVTCPFAQSCWYHAKLHATVEYSAGQVECFRDWFFKILDLRDDTMIGKICLILWNIWRQGNAKLWNGTHQSVDQTVFSAIEILCDWLAAKHLNSVMNGGSSEGTTAVHWVKPPANFLKCNIDAALFTEQRKVGLGMNIRDAAGNFVRCASQTVEGLFEVREAEEMGLREALSWIKSKRLGFSRVIFELDSQIVVNAVQERAADLTEFGAIIHNCIDMLSLETTYSVVFVKRQANEIAHVH